MKENDVKLGRSVEGLEDATTWLCNIYDGGLQMNKGYRWQFELLLM